MPISLADAIKADRLKEFIAQEEARGVGPVSEAAFDRLASTIIKTEQSDDQTSGSAPKRGWHGK